MCTRTPTHTGIYCTTIHMGSDDTCACLPIKYCVIQRILYKTPYVRMEFDKTRYIYTCLCVVLIFIGFYSIDSRLTCNMYIDRRWLNSGWSIIKEWVLWERRPDWMPNWPQVSTRTCPRKIIILLWGIGISVAQYYWNMNNSETKMSSF